MHYLGYERFLLQMILRSNHTASFLTKASLSNQTSAETFSVSRAICVKCTNRKIQNSLEDYNLLTLRHISLAACCLKNLD